MKKALICRVSDQNGANKSVVTSQMKTCESKANDYQNNHENLDLKLNTKARLIAFYLPQYHPIPENNEWWGKGFTEWTNVTKAKPLFSGHYQPHIPADLGFYDLRVPETRIAQAEMAQNYGIEGFRYWHYWFGEGRRILERPFNEVLKSSEPNFPFCLGWANQSWTGIWHGCPDKVLIKQTYPGMKDYEAHFYSLLDAFSDPRYMTIDGKQIFIIYRPKELPDPKRFTDYWRELAFKSGLKGLHFIGIAEESWVPNDYGFDASIIPNPESIISGLPKTYIDKICLKVTNRDFKQLYREILGIPKIYSYQTIVKHGLLKKDLKFENYPCVVPNWDNTPRSGKDGVVFHDSTPELFRIHLKEAIAKVAYKQNKNRIVFIKSWNEWAEGNYLEPDDKFGKAYLEVIQDEII